MRIYFERTLETVDDIFDGILRTGPDPEPVQMVHSEWWSAKALFPIIELLQEEGFNVHALEISDMEIVVRREGVEHRLYYGPLPEGVSYLDHSKVKMEGSYWEFRSLPVMPPGICRGQDWYGVVDDPTKIVRYDYYSPERGALDEGEEELTLQDIE